MSDDNSIIENSINAVKHTGIVPIILEILCRTTGLGFAAVARVTSERWIACEVKDEISFGLVAGGELKVDTTLCHEIRQKGLEVVIDDVPNDEYYCAHHTPAMYGFKSYISVPIWLNGHVFFGTLCGIDPRPAALKYSPVRDLFKVYARLIAFLIDAEKLPAVKFDRLKERSIMALRAHLLAFSGFNLEEQTRRTATTEANEQLQQLIQQSVDDMEKLLESLKADV